MLPHQHITARVVYSSAGSNADSRPSQQWKGAGMASAVTEQTGLDAELRAYVEERMAHYHLPGVAVGIYHEGVQQVGGMGVTNVDHPLAVNERTLFQIGSTS